MKFEIVNEQLEQKKNKVIVCCDGGNVKSVQMPEFSIDKFGDMSVAQIEECVSCVENNNGDDVRASKPSWWPFRFPASSGCTTVDVPKWREKLHDLAVKRSAIHSMGTGVHWERELDNSKPCGELGISLNIERPRSIRQAKISAVDSFEKGVAEPVATEYQPVVCLCDILKTSPNEISSDNYGHFGKLQFLNYFKLSSHTRMCSIPSKPEKYKHNQSHPRTLGNCPHIPFSSDLGIQLLKKWHTVPIEAHLKKLERLERYVSTSHINIRFNLDANYEVTFNKSSDCSHFYIFPTKQFHRSGRLTPKARYILKNYCKPCYVKIVKLEYINKKSKSASSSNQRTLRNNGALQTLFNSQTEKENKALRSHFDREVRVILNNDYHVFKENSLSYKTVPDRNSAPNFSMNNATSKTLPNKSSMTVRKQRNLVLKTLTPRNENSVQTTNIKESVEESTLPNCNNLINASVILTPINGFFGMQKPRTKSNKLHGQVSASDRKMNVKRIKLDKAVENKASLCNRRRISPRLHIVNNNHVNIV